MSEPHIVVRPESERCPYCEASASRRGGFLCGTYRDDTGTEEVGTECMSNQLIRWSARAEVAEAECVRLRALVKEAFDEGFDAGAAEMTHTTWLSSQAKAQSERNK